MEYGIHSFVTYMGGHGGHLPHFKTDSVSDTITVVNELILVCTQGDITIIDNHECTDYTLMLVWSKPNYKLYQICRINVGKFTKSARASTLEDAETSSNEYV